MSIHLERCREVAVQTAIKAADLIREITPKGCEIATKENIRDLVTNADKASERLIENRLAFAFPEFAFFGEETHKKGAAIDPNIPTWVVDPLDGTTNFVAGFPMFGVAIALCYKNEVLVGAICEVPTKRIFYAEKGAGASLNIFGFSKQLRVHESVPLNNSVICMGCPRPQDTRALSLEILRREQNNVRDIRIAGSAALTLCYMAMGGVHAYIDIDLGGPWDVAAGKLILEEAGGILTNDDGSSWIPKGGTQRIIAAADEEIHKHFFNSLQETERKIR